MDAFRWQRIRALFDEAVDLPSAEWEDVLQRRGADDDTRAAVRALLVADADALRRTSLSSQAPDLFAGVAPDEGQMDPMARAGDRFGAWRILREIARGGMGAVYLAERVEGEFAQQAALKVVHDASAAPDLLARFRYERQILANLAHPNIARLLDGGAGPSGEPYLAMEYVDGTDIRSFCDRRTLDIDARLRIFLTICDAVAYAHDHLVLHRDLKPANILVSADGIVKLLDFGLAKLVDPHHPAETTIAAQRLFTPEYAAPEQIKGEASTVAVDIYSLGVLLYELLVGRRPYRLKGRNAADIEQAILQVEPSLPSTRSRHDATATGHDEVDRASLRGTTDARLRRRLRGDLDAIVLKTLRKSPQDRYASVVALADDVRAHLEGRPVLARRGSRRYRIARYVRRHALALLLVSIAATSLLTGTAIAVWQAREAGAQRDAAIAAQAAAESEARKSRTTLDFMNRLFEQADPTQTQGTTVTAKDVLDKGAAQIRGDLTEQPEVRAEMMTAIGKAQFGLGLYAEALPMLREAAQLNEPTLDSHIETQSLYVRTLSRLGRQKEALEALEPLRARLAVETVTPVQVAKIDKMLGALYEHHQRMQEAEDALRRALAVEQATYGENRRETQDTLLELASLLSTQDRNDEARPIADRVVAAVRALNPPDPVYLATALGILGRVLHNGGASQQAEAVQRELLGLRTRIYGDDHPIVGGTKGALGGTLAALHRYEEAIELQTEALHDAQKHYGAESMWAADAAKRLALSLIAVGRLREAENMAREALRMDLLAFGQNHYRSALAYAVVGAIEMDQNNYLAAESSLQRALTAWEETTGTQSAYLIHPLADLAATRLLGHRPDPGCVPATRAVAILNAIENTDDPEAIYVLALRDACLTQANDPADPGIVEAAIERLSRVDPISPRWLRVLERVAIQLRVNRQP